MIRRSLIPAAVAAALAAPGSAHGAVLTFGSNLALSPSSNLTQAHGQDTAFWSTALTGGASPTAPASGQVLSVKVKGRALGGSASNRLIHFQALRPQSDGSVKVIVTTGGFTMPSTGDNNQVTTFTPENFCVQQGDYVDFNTVGGYEPPTYDKGIPFQIFGAAADARTLKYTAGDGTNNGAVFTGSTQSIGIYPNPSTEDAELLMQMQLGTGADGTALCPGGGSTGGGSTGGGTTGGGTTGGDGGSTGGDGGSTGGDGGGGGTTSPRAPVTIPSQRVGVNRRGQVSVAIFCLRPPCRGTVVLRSRGRRVGSGRFSVGSRRTAKVRIRLTRSAFRKVRQRRRLSVRMSVVASPGGAANTAARTITIRR